jgi:hypothetical protein
VTPKKTEKQSVLAWLECVAVKKSVPAWLESLECIIIKKSVLAWLDCVVVKKISFRMAVV